MPDETSDRLLEVAREILAKRGYVGLSMRTAAAAAGVTPDVARRYYRNRDALLAAALKLPVDPSTALPTLLAPGIEGMGERLVRFTIDVLGDPSAREELLSLARTGVAAGHAAAGSSGLHRAQHRGSAGDHHRRSGRADAFGADQQLPARRGHEQIRPAHRAAGLRERGGRHPDGGAGRSRICSIRASRCPAATVPAPAAETAEPTAAPAKPTAEPPTDPRPVRTFDPDPAATARRIASGDLGDD